MSSQPSYPILQPCTTGGGTQIVDLLQGQSRWEAWGPQLRYLRGDRSSWLEQASELLGYWLSMHTRRPWVGTLWGWGGSQGVSSVTMAAPLVNLAVCRSPKTRVGRSSCCPAALVGRLRPEVHTWHITSCSLGWLGPDQLPGIAGRGGRCEWRTQEWTGLSRASAYSLVKMDKSR